MRKNFNQLLRASFGFHNTVGAYVILKLDIFELPPMV